MGRGTLGCTDGERPSLTTRTVPPGVATPGSAPPDATPLVIPVDAPAPGRARPAAPLRREGPAKLTGEAKYADDLVFPGAWFGATIRSTEPHARLDRDRAGRRLRLEARRGRHRRRHPGRERRQPHRRRPAGARAGRRRDPPPGRAVRADRRARPGDAARGARATCSLRTERLPAGVRPARVGSRVRALHRRARRRGDGHGTKRRSSSRARTGSATRSSSTSRTRR